MNLFSLFQRRQSASVARDRLQILLSHERALVGAGSDLVSILRTEILEVVARHVKIDQDKVHVKMERGSAVSTLAVDIELPTGESLKAA